ncbi:MAG: MATE family efflux transporter [Deltaproteobacteria bacterium]|nr:MATE family efflux transporter [Deltaproteobacteria bacterium]
MSPDSSSPSGLLRRIVSLALPVIGLNLLGVVTLLVDTLMVGRMREPGSALAALGFATQVVFLLMVAMMGLTVGAAAVISRAHGAGQRGRVEHVLRQASLLTLLAAILVAGAGNLVARPVLELLGARGAALDLGLVYLRPILSFTVFYYLNTLYAASLRSVGETRLPFLVALISNALNVALDYGFVLGRWGLPALGVAGAAWATVVSQALGTLLLVVLLSRGEVRAAWLRIRPTPAGRRGFFSLDLELAAELFRVGAPAALDMVVMNVAFMSIVGMLGRVSEAAVAAHGIGLRVQSLAFVPGLGISQVAGALIGNALGSRDVAKAKRLTRITVGLCTLVMGALGLIFVAGAPELVRLFVHDPASQLARLTETWIRLLGYGMPLVGVHIAFVGMLRGSGDTRQSLRINLIGTFLFQVPASWILWRVLGWQAFGIWLAFPVSFGLKAALGWLAYLRGRWAVPGARLEPTPEAEA